MDVTVRDDRQHSRYEARSGDALAAIAEYIRTDELVVFTHTGVLDGFEAKGVASRLVHDALDDVRSQSRAARGPVRRPAVPLAHPGAAGGLAPSAL